MRIRQYWVEAIIAGFLACLHASTATAEPNKSVDNHQDYKKISIGFANASESPENTWRLFLVANYRAEIAAQKDKIAASYYYNADNKVYLQKKQLNELLGKNIDVLIISAAHESALNEELDKFHQAKIPVIAFDRGVNWDKLTSFLSTDNQDIGKLQAEWLVKELKGEGNVVMFGGVKGVQGAEDRMRAAREVFSKHPKIRVLAASFTNWRVDMSRQEMQKIVKQFPKIDGIWSCSSTGSWPALQVLEENKRPLVPSTGDHMNGYAKYLVQHNLRGFIYPFPATMSRDAVRMAIKAANHEPVERVANIPVTVYEPEKIKELVRLDKPDTWWIGDDKMPSMFLPAIK